tara:strand:+ start:782 stop:2341 length:1560 start_codon:yes stop_codon:yes gene_type:complete
MGLLDGTTQRQYYEANTFGGYQFTSLDDIITQFEIAYVGENKIIPKIKRTDIAFYAQRALQELSFDTFKSVKSQQIELPPSMVMPLPHDYINYTKISEVDSAGIKHPLYPTKHTSNPFQIEQDSEGFYQFDDGLTEELLNVDFTQDLLGTWNKGAIYSQGGVNFANNPVSGPLGAYTGDGSGTITFEHRAIEGLAPLPVQFQTNVLTLKQTIDVTGKSVLDISATGLAADTTTPPTANIGFLRVGVVTDFSLVGDGSGLVNHTNLAQGDGPITETSIFDLVDDSGNPSYVEWSVAGDNTATKNITGIDVSNVNSVDVVVISYIDPTNNAQIILEPTNTISSVSATSAYTGQEAYQSSLTSPTGNEKNSSTWNSYKSHTPSENNTNDYQDYQNDIYWPNEGRRYGLDPQHAQINGSFYIDDRLGRIHFSSNISGKTVILDYISDSLGTDAEMQVHKFAEDAMYKWMAHAILSTSSYGQPLVRRLTREKFAAVRKAKLRLSNIKLEEITQILRGKSKQIKH